MQIQLSKSNNGITALTIKNGITKSQTAATAGQAARKLCTEIGLTFIGFVAGSRVDTTKNTCWVDAEAVQS